MEQVKMILENLLLSFEWTLTTSQDWREGFQRDIKLRDLRLQRLPRT